MAVTEGSPWGACLLATLLAAGSALGQTCRNDIPESTPTSAFVLGNDGTATDTQTGLMWKRCAEGQTWVGGMCTGTTATYSWQGALQLADSSNFAGFTDWRTPNALELRSIVEQRCYGRSINAVVFPNTVFNFFWSSTPSLSTNAAVVRFDIGRMGSLGKSGGYAVRLVRAGQSLGSLSAPTGLSPSGSIGTLTPTFTWTGGTGATYYRIVVTNLGTSAALASPDLSKYASSWSVPTGVLQPGGSYKWTITSCVSACGAGSAAVSVEKFFSVWQATATSMSFVFDVIANQTPGVNFPIALRAVDGVEATLTQFNGVVGLSEIGGNLITPRGTLVFSGGTYSGAIKLASSGTARLKATFTNVDGSVSQGQSIAFTVATGPSPTFTVQGLVYWPANRQVLPGATVQLVNAATEALFPAQPVTADSNGRYQITQVPTGEWRVRGYYPGYHDDGGATTQTINKNLSLNVAMQFSGEARKPVLVLPGVMGSTIGGGRTPIVLGTISNWMKSYGNAPRLGCGPGNAAQLRDKLYIYDPLGGFTSLLRDLRDNSHNVVEVPWDWRLPMDQAVSDYLKPAIEKAKLDSGSTKVDIVAHSMGGLVARYYIQSSDYDTAQDVDRFIMIGTPNVGSTNAYYFMEGGDVKNLDLITRTFKTNVGEAWFYSAATNDFWLDCKGGDGIISVTGSGAKYLKEESQAKSDIKKLLNDDQEGARGARDLLPTYDFLRQWQSTWLHSDATDFQNGTVKPTPGLNPNLKAMNADANASRFVKIDAAAATMQSTQVRTLLLLSEDCCDTLFQVGFTPPTGTGTYTEGIPNIHTKRFGDGTVLSNYLGLLGPFGFFGAATAKVEFGSWDTHAAMPGDPGVQCQVIAALGGPACTANALRESTVRAQAVAATPTAYVAVDGNYQLLLTSPGGQHTGSTYGVAGIAEEIAGTAATVSSLQYAILHHSPADDTYQLSLSAEPTLALTAGRLRVGFQTSGSAPQEDSARVMVQATSYVLNIVVNSLSSPWYRMVDPVLPPTQLVATPSGGNALLSWVASSDPAVAGYRVYARGVNANYFQLLGQAVAAATQFATAIPWAANYAESTELVVLAINGSGVESLIRVGNSARNYSFAKANFTATTVNAQGLVVAGPPPVSVTFVDQSTATSGIASREWDFNGDGVADSTVASPTITFNYPGRYGISLRVTGMDGTSGSTTNPVFVTVNPLLTVTKSGTGTGTVTSTSAGIDCGATCSAAFEFGVPAGLVATPTAGSIFAGWLAACIGRGACAPTMNDTTTVTATFAPSTAAPLRIDADRNAAYDALTDGLVIIRYLFGLTGTSLTSGATSLDPTELVNYLNDIRPIFDVDGDGQVDALTDGLMLIRYLFGLRGPSLINGAVGIGATRDGPQIETYIQSLMP